MGLDNPLHIAFLLVILLLVFGAKRLPEMGRSLGEGLRGFKDTFSGEGGAHASHSHVAASAPGEASPNVPVEHHVIAAAPTVAPATPVQTPEMVAAARTLGAQRVSPSVDAIEREPELLRN